MYLGFHAEENCILEAGIKRARGGTLYVTAYPCIWCAKIIL